MAIDLSEKGSGYKDLLFHVGHTLNVVGYGPYGEDPVNVAIECEDCGEVLVEFDAPEQEA